MPYQRVGLCWGERCKTKPHRNVPLYRVGDIFRYRCRDCFKRETGSYP